LIFHGATGTVIEKRGVPPLSNAWNGGGALSRPDFLLPVYKDYIGAGAQLIFCNTFANSKHALEPSGELENFFLLNSRGVELAVTAREPLKKSEILVGGGISYWSWTGKMPSLKILGESVSEPAIIMKNAGSALLILEMMVDIERMVVPLESAQVAGLPFWVGFSCKLDNSNNISLLDGELFSEAFLELKAPHIALITIIHPQIELIERFLDVLAREWGKFCGVFPPPPGKDWDYFSNLIKPREYLKCSELPGRSTSIIGG
jgi:Homocysteine/selenocysteine methylase (S-methylmethionine-dependent)